MNYTIYISGPISDPTTGLPREGWQRIFLDAEAKLRRMGFSVINPVDIAREVDDAIKWRWGAYGGPCSSIGDPEKPTREDYIMACLQRMKMSHEFHNLHAVYVIGDSMACYASHGVKMELLLAEMMKVPIYAESRDDCNVDHNLVLQPGEPDLQKFTEQCFNLNVH